MEKKHLTDRAWLKTEMEEYEFGCIIDLEPHPVRAGLRWLAGLIGLTLVAASAVLVMVVFVCGLVVVFMQFSLVGIATAAISTAILLIYGFVATSREAL